MSSKTGSRLLMLQRHLDGPRASDMASQSSPLTTHVLDTASGVPARGLCLQLFRLEDCGQHWMELRKRSTHLKQCHGVSGTALLRPCLAASQPSGPTDKEQPEQGGGIQRSYITVINRCLMPGCMLSMLFLLSILHTLWANPVITPFTNGKATEMSYTDPDGRCPGLLTPGQMKPGIYKLFFDTENYWKERGQESFYPYVEIVFTVAKETQKFHVPLLLSPWSYTTYRGS